MRKHPVERFKDLGIDATTSRAADGQQGASRAALDELVTRLRNCLFKNVPPYRGDLEAACDLLARNLPAPGVGTASASEIKAWFDRLGGNVDIRTAMQGEIDDLRAALAPSRAADGQQGTRALLDALKWYGDEARAISENEEKKRTDGLMASMRVLSLDGGARARAALALDASVIDYGTPVDGQQGASRAALDVLDGLDTYDPERDMPGLMELRNKYKDGDYYKVEDVRAALVRAQSDTTGDRNA